MINSSCKIYFIPRCFKASHLLWLWKIQSMRRSRGFLVSISRNSHSSSNNHQPILIRSNNWNFILTMFHYLNLIIQKIKNPRVALRDIFPSGPAVLSFFGWGIIPPVRTIKANDGIEICLDQGDSLFIVFTFGPQGFGT